MNGLDARAAVGLELENDWGAYQALLTITYRVLTADLAAAGVQICKVQRDGIDVSTSLFPIDTLGQEHQ